MKRPKETPIRTSLLTPRFSSYSCDTWQDVTLLGVEPPDSEEASRPAEEAAVAAVQQATRDVEAVAEQAAMTLQETERPE